MSAAFRRKRQRPLVFEVIVYKQYGSLARHGPKHQSGRGKLRTYGELAGPFDDTRLLIKQARATSSARGSQFAFTKTSCKVRNGPRTAREPRAYSLRLAIRIYTWRTDAGWHAGPGPFE